MDEIADPPIHADNFLSGESITLTSFFIDSLAKALIYFVNLSGNPLNIEEPPDKKIKL